MDIFKAGRLTGDGQTGMSYICHGFHVSVGPWNHYQFASFLSPYNILDALDYRASRKCRLKIGKMVRGIDVVKQALVPNGFAIPSKTKPHNVLHIKIHKEAVMWT